MSSTQIDEYRVDFNAKMDPVAIAKMYHDAVDASKTLEYEGADLFVGYEAKDEVQSELCNWAFHQAIASQDLSHITPDQRAAIDLYGLDFVISLSEKHRFYHELESVKIVTMHICAVKKIIANLDVSILKSGGSSQQQNEARVIYVRRLDYLSSTLHGLLSGPFDFLKLPLELRIIIYMYGFAPVGDRQVFPIDQTVLWQPFAEHSNAETKFWRSADGNIVIPRPKPNNPGAILMTCKQIRAEASPFFMATAEFTITTASSLPRSMLLNPFVLSHMRTINVDWRGVHAAEVFSFLNRCKGLANLQVSVDRRTVNGDKGGDLYDFRRELRRATWKKSCLVDTIGCNELCMMRGLTNVRIVCDSLRMPTSEKREFASLEEFLLRSATQPREMEGLQLIVPKEAE